MTAVGAKTMFNLVVHIGIVSSWALSKETMFSLEKNMAMVLEILGPNMPFRKHMQAILRVMLIAATTGNPAGGRMVGPFK